MPTPDPLFDLTALDPSSGFATTFEVAPDLRAPMIQKGRDGRTVVIAYVSSVSGRLVSVEIDALPQELGHIADKARSHIIDLGREFRDLPRDLPSIAGKARSHIIDLGRAFPESSNLAAPDGCGEAQPSASGPILTLEDMKNLERDNILKALVSAHGRIYGEGGAAELLGMNPSTLRSRMKALGIKKYENGE